MPRVKENCVCELFDTLAKAGNIKLKAYTTYASFYPHASTWAKEVAARDVVPVPVRFTLEEVQCMRWVGKLAGDVPLLQVIKSLVWRASRLKQPDTLIGLSEIIGIAFNLAMCELTYNII